jgi:hypothetical protein
MEEKILEKKVLSLEEIESQSLLELPDRHLLQVDPSNINIAVLVSTVVLILLGGY